MALCQQSASAITFQEPENWTSWAIIVAIALICLCISAFVSGSEISYFGLKQSDIEELEETDSSNAQKALSLIKNPENFWQPF